MTRIWLGRFKLCRWKRDDSGDVMMHPESGKPIMQFVCIQRKDSGEWALPGVS